MFCSNCGRPLLEGSRFCGNCGARVEQAASGGQSTSGGQSVSGRQDSSGGQERASAQGVAGAQSGPGSQSSFGSHGGPGSRQGTFSQATSGEPDDTGGRGTSLVLWEPLDIAFAVILWILTAQAVLFIVFGISFGSIRIFLTNLIRLIACLPSALICTLNMRGEQCQEEKDDIFLIFEAAAVLSLIAFLIDVISGHSGPVELISLVGMICVLVVYYFRLGKPQTLITKPYAVTAVPNSLVNLFKVQQNVSGQMKAEQAQRQQEMAKKYNLQLSYLVSLAVGICAALLQILALFVKMVSASALFISMRYSYAAILREGDVGFFVVILVIAALAQIVLLVIRHGKLSLIPQAVNLVGLIGMFAMFEYLYESGYGSYMQIGPAVWLYLIGVIAGFAAPFIRIPKKES